LNYKIDYRIFKDKKEFDNYIALFEDAGMETCLWHKTVETNIFADE